MSKLQRIVRGERQKELARIFDVACERNNRWTVWSDFMTMYAIAIANTVDHERAPDREKIYMTLVTKYNQKELNAMSSMFALIVEAIDANPDQDFLGDLFMSFELGNQHAGQFFTPYCICKAMAQMNDVSEEIKKKGWISVNDPACGAGALLVAFANQCRTQGINYQSSVLFVAQDIDYTTACMCYIQLSLLGCPGYVVVGNTITNPSTCYDQRGLIPVPGENIWFTPMWYRTEWHWRRVFAGLDLMVRNNPIEKEKPLVAPAPEKSEPELKALESGQLTLF